GKTLRRGASSFPSASRARARAAVRAHSADDLDEEVERQAGHVSTRLDEAVAAEGGPPEFGGGRRAQHREGLLGVLVGDGRACWPAVDDALQMRRQPGPTDAILSRARPSLTRCGPPGPPPPL
ncbi:unnamed protein product, partial [Ixodes hexagonus]